MDIKEEFKKLEAMPIEERAKCKLKHASNEWVIIPMLIGIICGILYATYSPEAELDYRTLQKVYGDNSIYNVISPFLGFILFSLGGIAIGFLFVRIREKHYEGYNKLILDAYRKVQDKTLALSKAQKEAMEQEIIKKYGDERMTITFGKFNSQKIIINEEKRLIRLCETDLQFDSILNFKVIDDAKEIFTPAKFETKTNTGSVIGRALIGGMLTGGIGAIIGGATAKKDTVQIEEGKSKTTHDYSIFVYLDRLEDSQLELKTGPDKSKTEKIASVLNYIVNKNEEKKNLSVDSESTKKNTESITEELSKLAKLKEQGMITESEFQSIKSKILKSD